MTAVVGAMVWLGVTLFALFSLFRPLAPLRNRKQALALLVVAQVLAVMGALATPTPQADPIAASFTPVEAPKSGEPKTANQTGDPSFLVRTSPAAPAGPQEVGRTASKADIESLKAEMGAGLRTLNAARTVLENAAESQNASLAREAESSALKVAFAMTKGRQVLEGTREFEAVLACDRAAYKLADLARSTRTDGQGVEAVERRLALDADYERQRQVCWTWVGR